MRLRACNLTPWARHSMRVSLHAPTAHPEGHDATTSARTTNSSWWSLCLRAFPGCRGLVSVGVSADVADNEITGLASAKLPPDVGCHLVLANRLQHRGIDGRGFFLHPERIEHQCRR